MVSHKTWNISTTESFPSACRQKSGSAFWRHWRNRSNDSHSRSGCGLTHLGLILFSPHMFRLSMSVGSVIWSHWIWKLTVINFVYVHSLVYIHRYMYIGSTYMICIHESWLVLKLSRFQILVFLNGRRMSYVLVSFHFYARRYLHMI